MKLNLQIVGLLLVFLGLAHIFFPRYFGWHKELAGVSLFTRQVFFVHCFFLALILILQGVCSFFYAGLLLQRSELSRAFLFALVLFWGLRWIFQFLVYDAAIWRGRRFYTSMHILFSVLWTYIVGTYAQALRQVW